MTTTTDLADFGARERRMLITLLQAWQERGLPADFDDSGVRPMMNRNSGSVFLTNENYQVAMMNGDKLESFYSCPYGGAEGFLTDILAENDPDDLNAKDVRYLRDVYESSDFDESDLPAAWRATMMEEETKE